MAAAISLKYHEIAIVWWDAAIAQCERALFEVPSLVIVLVLIILFL